MESKNYFLPHGGHAATFPTPRPWIATTVETSVSPLSLPLEASLIQQALLKSLVNILIRGR